MIYKINLYKFFIKKPALIFLLSLYFYTSVANAQTTIGDGETTNTSAVNDNSSVLFTGSSTGILNHNSESTLADAQTNNNGIGSITINSTDDLTINGDVGSSSKKINQITFSGSQNLYLGGDVYTKNGITSIDGDEGDVTFSGNNATIESNIGASDSKLGSVFIDGNSVLIKGNIFTNNTIINPGKKLTISNSTDTNQLGVVTADGASLILNSNASLVSLSTSSTSTFGVDAGKQATIGQATTFNGTLDIGIDRSDGGTPSISLSSGAATVSASAIDFDYSDASYLKSGDVFTFIDASSVTLNPSNIIVTDNSILLKPTLAGNSGNATNAIDSTTTSRLNSPDLSTLNQLIGNSSISNIDTIRTALFKISTQNELENALDTLQIEQNNMIPMASFDIANQVRNIVEYRVNSLNYQNKTNYYDKINYVKNNKKLWGNIFGSSADQSGSDGEEGFDYQNNGIIFGYDGVLKSEYRNFILGGTFSYSKGRTNSNSVSNQETAIDSYQFSLYNHNSDFDGLGVFNFNSVNIGYNQYDSERTIKVGTFQTQAKAEFSAIQYGAKAGIGYNKKMGENFIFSPSASLKYSGIKISDYAEKGAGDIGLKVKNSYFDQVSSDTELRLVGKISSKVQAQFKTSWTHNFNDRGQKTRTSFIGDSQNTTQNVGIDTLSNIYGLGTKFTIDTAWDQKLSLKYDLQRGSGFTGHSASIQYSWEF
jgi:outer membrane autotransporter protein